MDSTLRCNSKNNGFCRKILSDWAILTTCSHVFCQPCATQAGITNPNHDRRKCPACSTELLDRHDVVETDLKPTEEYKTTVLSGLDPNTVVECADRALAFWNYQMSEEMRADPIPSRYQEYLVKALTAKYGQLDNALNQTVATANEEIEKLQAKYDQMAHEMEKIQQKNQEVLKLYHDRNQKYQTVQQLYNVLKNKVQSGQQERLVALDAQRTIQSIRSGPRPETYSGRSGSSTRPSSHVRTHQSTSFQRSNDLYHTHQRSESVNGPHSGFTNNVVPLSSARPSRLHMVHQDTVSHIAPIPVQPPSRSAAFESQIPVLGSHDPSYRAQSAKATRQHYSASTHQPEPSYRHGIVNAMKVGIAERDLNNSFAKVFGHGGH